ANNESADSVANTDRLSQTGSEAPMSLGGGRPESLLLNQLRQLLTRGQRRVAITFAQSNGLFDHAMALAYLLSFQTAANVGGGGSSGNSHQLLASLPGGDCGLMIATIRKFITSTLETSDPRK